MNDEEEQVEESTTRKRSYDDEEEDSQYVKRREPEKRSHRWEDGDIRFDFTEKPAEETYEDASDFLEKLVTIKQQLNEVKSLLSDKDIADWNKHTAYMNSASTIVPYLREKLKIEIGTQAWAKMFEILAKFDIVNHQSDSKWITLHLCEAPGAFISALNHFLVTREENQKIDWHWFAQTLNPYYEHDPSTAAMLIDDDRLIFHTIDGNHWDFGNDNSGNLMHQDNIDHYISRFQPMGISLITADGSFDVQDNPGEQELLVYPLLKTEIHVALSCLKKHGNFVLKVFTMFERVTIDLIYLLYRTFRQISMFKPKTSKKGNSEMYVICIDFNGEHVQTKSVPYSSVFLTQLTQCSQFFQSHQISTIEYNLDSFHNLNRKSRKRLHQIKEQNLNAFLDQCQTRELLSDDRHLSRRDNRFQRLYCHNDRISRTGTFNDRHQIDDEIIREKIQKGFFCLTCSNAKNSERCDGCQKVSQIIENPSISIKQIYIGQLIADSPAIIECVFGQPSTNIRNSCFCNRYLLELCSPIDLHPVLVDEERIDSAMITTSASTDISREDFFKLQQFVNNYQMNFRCHQGIYYVQSPPILTRLQASVIYLLTRAFSQATIYVLPSSPCLLFVFIQSTKEPLNTEYQRIEAENLSSSTGTLLQMISTPQLLDQRFTYHLIQANHRCLQLRSNR